MRRFACLGQVAALVLLLGGCETASKLGDGLSGVKDKALEAVGFKRPEVPESAKPARKMSLRIAASESLNVDASGRSLSLVVRVYKLRGTAAFLNAPYEIFGNAAKEKEVLGDDLLESREVILFPGQQQRINERWAREAPYVGVVGLFRAPALQRWRYAFELDSFQQSDDGIVLGAHACALSVASGTPVGTSTAAMKLASPACDVLAATGSGR